LISIVVISKDEPTLEETLQSVWSQASLNEPPCELIVVDASVASIEDVKARNPFVRWLDFRAPPGAGVTIAHQRNVGVREARGDVIVFTDCGCVAEPDWLERLIAPVFEDGEHVVCGRALGAVGGLSLYDGHRMQSSEDCYVSECPTINLALTRHAFDAVGGFDEGFSYGSDIDFSWRLVSAGFRILSVPEATVRHDWGGARRQMRRSFAYGRARARLYRKHSRRLLQNWATDPMVWAYPSFLLGLPLTLVFPLYPALLAIPAWRSRSHRPLLTVIDHLLFGAGVIRGLFE
jgi:GT2 family glycosyltransferase